MKEKNMWTMIPHATPEDAGRTLTRVYLCLHLLMRKEKRLSCSEVSLLVISTVSCHQLPRSGGPRKCKYHKQKGVFEEHSAMVPTCLNYVNKHLVFIFNMVKVTMS